MKAVIQLNIEKLPFILFGMRQRLADMLRERAQTESDPRVARALMAVAADFEVGA